MKTKIVSNVKVSQNFFPEEITPDQYVLGETSKLPTLVLMPRGIGWGKYLPIGETQYKNGIDPQSCPAGGWLNCIEALGLLQYKRFGFQSDLSERFLSIVMGMNGNGGSPHVAAEAVRTYGCVPEVFLPFDQSITTLPKYFSPKPIPYDLWKVGQSWKNKYKFGHEWLFYGNEPLLEKQKRIKTALQYSIVGASVYAWSLHDDDKYYKDGPDIHWCDIFACVEGEYWLIFDTYPDATGSYVKKLDWNFNFGYAKRGSLELTDAYRQKLQIRGMEMGEEFGDEFKMQPPSEEDKGMRFQYAIYLVTYYINKFLKK